MDEFLDENYREIMELTVKKLQEKDPSHIYELHFDDNGEAVILKKEIPPVLN